MSALMTNAVIGMPFDLAMANDLSRQQFYTRAQALLAENKALAACIEGLAISLESEVAQRYAGLQAHPALKRKYDSDMSEVLEARALVAKVVQP